jgi:hypothetical protein
MMPPPWKIWITLLTPRAATPGRAGEVCLGACVGQQGRDIKQAKYANGLAVGGGDQITADQNGEQDGIEGDMGGGGGKPGQARLARQRLRHRGDVAPDNADNQAHHQQNADALMQFWCLVIPAIVVAEGNHPQPEAKHGINGNGHDPV